MSRIPVGVLGATRAVGQRFISLLAHHPWFELTDFVGLRTLGRQTLWRRRQLDPGNAAAARCCEHEREGGWRQWKNRVILRPRVLFLALPTEDAEEMEPTLAAAGHYIFSNASPYRMTADVPLVVTEINPEHLNLVRTQQANRGWEGFIVCNANCTATHLVGALIPPFGFRVGQSLCRHNAGCIRSGLSGRPLARLDRQYHAAQLWRRRQGAGRATQDHGNACRRRH